MADYKEIFDRECQQFNAPVANIVDGNIEPELSEMNRLYGRADALSIQNGKKHRLVLLLLSMCGTVLTLVFLLYDELEMYSLIFACGAMILCLFIINYISSKLECHRKYLQYRILAEALRLQYYLVSASIETRVVDIMPWFIKESIPWLDEVLAKLSLKLTDKKQSVLNFWINDQCSYHQKALAKTETKKRKEKFVSNSMLIITVLVYIFTFVFEVFVLCDEQIQNKEMIRVALKVVLGTCSAITLFTNSYYGKMSLSQEIDDHRRMISLYQKTRQDISNKGESEATILFLAREYLNENSSWYAYQKKNGSDVVL